MKDKGFRTKKKFGQHLLIASGVIQKIVDEIDVKPEDIIVEIGVGTGQLTEEILKRNPKKLYGIEIDPEAYPIIEEKFSGYENFQLIKKDFFDVNLFELAEGQKIKVVGNLPYNVASLILVNMPFYLNIIQLCVFMLQKEVAEKLIAKPKTKQYTFLSVFIQTFFDVEYVMSVPARFFKPPPKVTSAVVKLIPKENPPIDKIKEYKNFVSHLFSARRKMLRTKLPVEVLKKADIPETARAEELTVEDFINLFKNS
ncbi:16S rRNA (adenine(1518)-N(6)/adenine(1519)-N(6))-dimethyltransferase RsmA [Persephonella sp.]|uniref:16S rRNA (adenine(1518)-N(6)/adenine(1519)-N(6))- dimethyltransferase RsmA n=1 Tax=Persephonella sp. TaxID=2060922 RepID=UPI0026361F8F|nr:16S rRNA (adenine(1518)-N(6)/adenine(1519)-N(6))-dimethyltransferase RsmA [Persephonella sp.]